VSYRSTYADTIRTIMFEVMLPYFQYYFCSNSLQNKTLGELRKEPSIEVESMLEPRHAHSFGTKQRSTLGPNQRSSIGTIEPKRHNSMMSPKEMQRRHESGSRPLTELHATKSARSLGLHGRPKFNLRHSMESQVTLYQDDDHNESLEKLYNERAVKKEHSTDETNYRLKRSSEIDMLQQLRRSAGGEGRQSSFNSQDGLSTKRHSTAKIRRARGDHNESLESIHEGRTDKQHSGNDQSTAKRHSKKKRSSKAEILQSSIDELEDGSEKKMKKKKSKKKRQKNENPYDVEKISKAPARKADTFKGKVITVLAPSGSLGIFIGDPSDEPDDGEYDPSKFLPIIKSLSESCVISEKVLAGDKIMSIDEINCKGMPAEMVMSLIDSRADKDFRTLLLVRDV